MQVFLDGRNTNRGGTAEGDELSNIERVLGSFYADTLTGGDGNNLFRGGDGADIMDGGAGSDWADYRDSSEAVTVYLNGTAGSGGTAAGDELRNIEHIAGSAFDDTILGDDGINVLRGGDGADTLDGGDGNDVADYRDSGEAVQVFLDGSNPNTGGTAEGDVLSNIERVYGSRFDDTITGDDGNNLFRGGDGADTLDGGAGSDWANYRDSGEAVTVYLDGTTGSGGTAAGDELRNIEHIAGSAFDDTILGDDGNNVLRLSLIHI